MATLRPFPALRPSPQNALAVSAVPYDVVNREEAARLATGNPLSFLHVSRPEIDLDPSVDPHSAPVYVKARNAFDRLKHEAPLVLEDRPLLYLYRLKQGAHEQTGIAATFSLSEYEQGIIRRHERTLPEKEDDRTRHLLALKAQTGPAYLAYRGTPAINQLVNETQLAEKPLYDFTAEDGVQHTIWLIPHPAPLVQEFARVPRLYIADGHHRTASASRAHTELGAGHPNAAHAFFLAVAFPAEQLRILAYHRVVSDLGGKSSQEFLNELRKTFQVKGNASPSPVRGEFSMYLEGSWFGLRPLPQFYTRNLKVLDVTLLQERILQPLLGVIDPREDPRLDFVGGSRGTAELERLVKSGQAAVAFAVHPTSMEDLLSCADAGEMMPPKSTWFEPKLRDGLLSHVLH